ncbi:MAG: membrane protein insertase YidC [Prevotella sp.]|nr:membrane protein insertase YidC [Prevotella sp.]
MDKNTITGFVLIALVLIGFSVYTQPSAEEKAAMAKQDSIAAVARQNIAENQKKAAVAKQEAAKAKVLADTTALFHDALTGKAENIVLRNNKVELTLSTKGATVEKAVIKGYKSNNTGKDGIILFEGNDQQLNYTFAAKEANIATQDLYFSPTNVTDSTATFTADAGNGKNIVISYTLGKDYMLHTKMQMNGMAGLFAPNTTTMNVDWSDKCKQQEKGYSFENRYATLTYHYTDGGTDQLSETSDKTETIDEKTDWVAFKNQFFSAVMIAKNDFAENAILSSTPQEKGSGYLKQYNAQLKAFFDPTGRTPTELDFYYGPNDFRLLQKADAASNFGKDLEMQRLVYLGWPLFRIINRWFTLYVFDFLTQMNINMGLVLILITMLMKLITYPMVKKSYMSSAKMRVLKPKLEEATKQYNKPEDQMQKQQAMMAEYAKYGVSPLSGCLPMLIQMPIWIAMFNFVPNAIQLRGESFLWINDLSTYDPLFEWSNNLWLIGDHLSLTCILFVAAQLLYSWITMRQQQDQMVGQQAEQMKMMKWMMLLMPLMFFFIFNDYSAGLNFYYFVSLFFSAAIMWTLRKTTDDEKLLSILEARYEENKKNPNKMSGLAARMQAMQQQAAEMQRRQQEMNNRKR